jgi:hypothetical protein
MFQAMFDMALQHGKEDQVEFLDLQTREGENLVTLSFKSIVT